VIVAHEVARALGVPCIFSEREGGIMTLRRGFSVAPGDRVLLVEDVITTGGSVLELDSLVRAAGGKVAGFGCIVDRSGGASKLPVAPRALVKMDLPAYRPESCPMCRDGSKPVKPGSRTARS
jgi:orotate phosphoribosyltransferase